ncbi:hypothetical protein L7F22_005210 [Adiantum nelumboides]|nr:hypothetical protein [Adiantum nelumboides]
MLTVCGRPHSYWEKAISTACYLQNRIFTTTLPNQTPYFRWFGHKPDLSHTRIFGCDAYAVSTDPHRGKLDHKAISTIFVGYGERFGHKEYRLYDPIGRRILFSRSVIFDELQLLKGNTATSSPSLCSPIDSIHAHDSTPFTKSSSIPLSQLNSNLLHNPSLPLLSLPSPSCSTNDSHNSTFELLTSPSLQASSSSDPLPTLFPPPRMMRSLTDIYAQTNAISCTPPAEPEFPDPILVDDGTYSTIYTSHTSESILVLDVYVDDIPIMSDKEDVLIAAKKELSQAFPFTDGGSISYCLGLLVQRDYQKATISLSQSRYVAEVLQRFNLSSCKGVDIPLTPSVNLISEMMPVTPNEQEQLAAIPYMPAIGGIRYLVTCTRPDICYTADCHAANTVARPNPTATHTEKATTPAGVTNATEDAISTVQDGVAQPVASNAVVYTIAAQNIFAIPTDCVDEDTAIADGGIEVKPL